MTSEELERDVETLNFGAVTEVAKVCHATARSKGFWEENRPLIDDIALRLMLIVTEVAEAMEHIRLQGQSAVGYDFSTELADIVIRVFDLAHAYQIDIGKKMKNKMAINVHRAYKHTKLC